MTIVRKHGITVAAAVMLIVGLLGLWMAFDATSSEAAENRAVVDKAATSKVQAEVSQALTRVLSYDHSNPGTTEEAADALLVGNARKEYDTLFESLQDRAPKQKLILTATVAAAGVKELTDDTAELLVFLDQSSRRADDKEASISAAQIAISAKKVDGAWRITELKPL
ncbi:MAG: hypothetical protein H7288_17805 [Kineosporiaceae bacterium]|nr:hypothetical protein [Aeromicrobium sp.]